MSEWAEWVVVLWGFTNSFSNRCWKFELSILKNKKVLFLKNYIPVDGYPNFQWRFWMANEWKNYLVVQCYCKKGSPDIFKSNYHSQTSLVRFYPFFECLPTPKLIISKPLFWQKKCEPHLINVIVEWPTYEGWAKAWEWV